MMVTQPKQRNIGCGDGYGRWLFEEFQIDPFGIVLGRAVVTYGHSLSFKRDDFGRKVHVFSIRAPVVEECCLYDQFGEEMVLNEQVATALKDLVMSAFMSIQCRVEEHELFLEGIIG